MRFVRILEELHFVGVEREGQRGDQLVTLMVDVPEDAELARFLEGWSGKGKGNPSSGLGL